MRVYTMQIVAKTVALRTRARDGQITDQILMPNHKYFAKHI